MNDELIIYIDRLESGKSEEIDCKISPDFMRIEEQDLKFDQPVEVRGNFYTTPDHLIGNLSLKTYFKMPCSICDESISIPCIIEDYYITEPLENISSGLYYPHDGIREAILIEVPSFYECNNGDCPSRKIFAPFMDNLKEKKEETTKSYLPFKDLE